MNATVRRQLDIWENFQNLLWCCWAMMMWESRHESVYRAIARDKYEALKEKIRTPDTVVPKLLNVAVICCFAYVEAG